MKKSLLGMLSLSLVSSLAFTGCAKKAESKVLEGEAEGYGGPIKATVTVTDNKITALELVGEGETPAVGGEAIVRQIACRRVVRLFEAVFPSESKFVKLFEGDRQIICRHIESRENTFSRLVLKRHIYCSDLFPQTIR